MKIIGIWLSVLLVLSFLYILNLFILGIIIFNNIRLGVNCWVILSVIVFEGVIFIL